MAAARALGDAVLAVGAGGMNGIVQTGDGRVIFGFFTLIAKGNPPGRLDPVSWIWVEVTLIPAVVLAAALIGTVAYVRTSPLRALGAALVAGMVVGSLVGFGCGWLARGRRRTNQ